MDPQTESEMRRAQDMHQCVAAQLAGKYPRDDRRDLLARFVSLTQSHHEAIMLLCYEERLIGSAFALWRPLVEASYRGSFVAFLATPEQIEQIKRGETPYGNMDTLARNLDNLFKTDGLFARHAGQTWAMMCGFTHGGLEQLNRRIENSGEIGCYFDQEEVQHLLANSTLVLVRSALQFLGEMERQEARDVVNARFVSLYSAQETIE